MNKPLLSIGMIFKNESRCLERCLRSLTPLRTALPCELVLADTGSTDGSREIAARYADTLFDIPWTDDFSAARNAVLDRSTGRWYLTVDADEWLDGDISELTAFLRAEDGCGLAYVVQRNYLELEDPEAFSDFLAPRLARPDMGLRYAGKIHELFTGPAVPERKLAKTVLHHDGYLPTQGRNLAKMRRNMLLLRGELARRPDDLLLLLQCIESSLEYEKEYFIRLGLEAVARRAPQWEGYGPAIYRYAVRMAQMRQLPELTSWAGEARSLFPASAFVRMDINLLEFAGRMDLGDWENAIPLGEAYLQARREHKAGVFDFGWELSCSSLLSNSQLRENLARTMLSKAYLQGGRREDAEAVLREVDKNHLEKQAVGYYAEALIELSGEDSRDELAALWEAVSGRPVLEEAFLSAGAAALQKGEGKELFLPLAGKCPLGDAARILNTENLEELTKLLASADWDKMPVEALAHALRRGAVFPTAPVNQERLEALALRLAEIAPELTAASVPDSPVGLSWSLALAEASVDKCRWDAPEDMDLARRYVRAEERYLSFCYTPEGLENVFLLPPRRRFGWYCVQAFRTLKNGDAAGYVRLLRTGLENLPERKDMLAFLSEHIPPTPAPELLALAEQVRAILAQYPPDDPAVLELKASPVYQKVAYLLE